MWTFRLLVPLICCFADGVGALSTSAFYTKGYSLIADANGVLSTPAFYRSAKRSSLIGRTMVLVESESAVALKAALVDICLNTPNNGIGATPGRRKEIESLIQGLEAYCMSEPAFLPLNGVYDLLYCTSTGSSSGKLGPFVGAVTQEFVDETKFINAVRIFGDVLKVELHARRQVLSATMIRVTFECIVFSLFNFEIFRKKANGSGTWEQRYVDDTLRVMNTPSLFVLRKRKAALDIL